MAEINRRESIRDNVGGVSVGGASPIVVQSMTNTDTADVEGTARQVTDAVARLGLEGVIAKRKSSRYDAGMRGEAWVKLKLEQQQRTPGHRRIEGGMRRPGEDPTEVADESVADSIECTGMERVVHMQRNAGNPAFARQPRERRELVGGTGHRGRHRAIVGCDINLMRSSVLKEIFNIRRIGRQNQHAALAAHSLLMKAALVHDP